MRHFMVDPDNEERLLKVPPHVVKAIKREALNAAREAVAALDVGRDVRFSVDVRDDALAAIDALREAQ